ncbi:phenylacetic acid degradation operon negative regulatory protein PaaX [Roseospira visakhapatnamensis]|uniref:Phenylacetic acid degradation operon negative regulatory protein n=1 Tax=Roseospira visakhapatnamensis TaxID=390880 RepID=A0A7W6RAU3_9PROT|nr:phenylacetic acid degradation operon negative regulatory protein PaaX [Roseospira visakhapatnamensis]MBB4264942.1 phenylacetic acid degradation operon negative regulatory protein [Roseospira visakhapatnamensis]
MSRTRRLDDLVAALPALMPVRATSLLVTIYGDSILPHGGSTWLGSLIRLVAPLGLSERMVRTAVFRLARDGWLSAAPVGRRSYYSVTAEGRRRFDAAHRRIYAADPPPWDGDWLLVLTSALPLEPEAREALRRELLWQGFGTLAPTVLAHPRGDEDGLRQILDGQGLADRVVVMRARDHPLTGPAAGLALVRAGWDLDTLAAGYHAFLGRFRPLWQALRRLDDPAPDQGFLIRTLLIHDYRRVLLRDPLLPAEVLPDDWPGAAARQLCRTLYRATQAAAERHLMARLETADGPLPDAAPAFHARFGGLDDAAPIPTATPIGQGGAP